MLLVWYLSFILTHFYFNYHFNYLPFNSDLVVKVYNVVRWYFKSIRCIFGSALSVQWLFAMPTIFIQKIFISFNIYLSWHEKNLGQNSFCPRVLIWLVFPGYFSICFESITQPSFICIHLTKCYGPSTSTNPNPAAKRGGRSPKLVLSLSFTLSCLGVSARSLNSDEISTGNNQDTQVILQLQGLVIIWIQNMDTI